jgi:ABC-2 type transport system permease protein
LNSYITWSPTFWISLLVAIPALTMRLIAEERRTGTIETLLTVPVTETEVVLAKWLAGVGMYLVLLVPFVVYLPFLYFQAGFQFDPGPMLALGIGLVTMGMMFVAIGLFFSALSRNQTTAAIWTFVALFMLIVLTTLCYWLAAERQAPWADSARFLAVLDQVQTLGTGQLDIRYPVLHLSVCVLMLYMSVKVLESRRYQ